MRPGIGRSPSVSRPIPGELARALPRSARRFAGLVFAVVAIAGLLRAAPARPDDAADLEVGDPIEAELRVLDLVPGAWDDGRSPMPPWSIRPVLRRSVLPPDSARWNDPIARISWIRLERALHRDRPGAAGAAPPGATPYLIRVDDTEDDHARFDVSASLEGRLLADPDTVRFGNFSGLHLRGALGFEHWVLQTHWVIGQVDSARQFGDPIVTGQDVIATTEQALIGYSSPGDHWGVRFGRGRWQWGPGNEGSLLLSRTSAPLTALEVHAALLRGRLWLTQLSANLSPLSQNQLAAHRIEWRIHDGLQVAASEAAIYASSGWRPLYLLGLIPYTVVQRLEAEDDPSLPGPLRNNVLVSFDGAWRIARGSRLYGELLLDDVHARTNDVPDKLGFQVGWDGAGTAMGRRLRWNTEYTRLTPYVYTSYFGRVAAAQGRPLGFPTGPDAKRLRLFVACDPSADFELSAAAARTDQGEDGLGDPYVPGTPRPSSIWKSIGVVQRTRSIEATLRWWPAGGVDFAVTGGYDWRENDGHVAGRDRAGGRVELALRAGR